MTRYRALKTWQQANDYDISTAKIFISSIAVNTRTEELYVAYTFSRSAIVRMPLRCQSSSEVSVYVSDGVKYNIPQTYPRPRNGNLNSAKVTGFSLVTFPMHMEYDGDDNVLYWVEVYSHLSSGTSVGALGAVAVRRLQLDTLEVDYYAGNEGSFRSIIGRSTGYKDGFSNKAQLSYPVTLSFYSSTGKLGTGPQLYVADYGNSAIRRVSTWVDTPSPTLAPTISQRPTVAPTVSHRPTSSPTVAPTIRPTSPPSLFPTVAPSSSSPTSSAPTSSPTPLPSAEPTLAPTVSHAPTLQMAPTSIPTALNGDCLLITLVDEFGDGWSGATFILNHTGEVAPPVPGGPLHNQGNRYFTSDAYAPSPGDNPLVFQVCASLDEDRWSDRGSYTMEIHLPWEGVHNEWEILWQVATKSSGYYQIYSGDSKTRMDFNFGSSGEFEIREPPTRGLVKKFAECRRCRHPSPPPPPPPPHDPNPQPDTPLPKEHDLPFVLHDVVGDGWFLSSGLGTRYSISDNSKTHLLDSGTVCGDLIKEDCVTSLPDGDYYFRVGGAGDEDAALQVSWTFCGVSGGASEELSFAMHKGKCIPGRQQTAAAMGATVERTTVTMRGEVLVENVFASTLSVLDTVVMEAAIASILGVDEANVAVLSVCSTDPHVLCSSGYGDDDDNDDDNDDGHSGHRRTSMDPLPLVSHLTQLLTFKRHLTETYVLDITFVVSVVVEDYDVVGSNYHDVDRFVNDKQRALDDSFRDGSLQSTIRYFSSSYPSSTLSFARIDRVLPIRKTDISYSFVSLSSSPTPGPIGNGQAAVKHVIMDETLRQEGLIFIPVLLVALAAVAVLVAAMWRQVKTAELGQGTDDSTRGKGWRERVLGDGDGSERTEIHSERSATAASDGENDTLHNEKDLVRIPEADSRSRYRQREGMSRGNIIGMVNIHASAGEKNLRNQIQLNQDGESSV